MGIHRENGYSATVEGYVLLSGCRLALAKTNGSTFTLVEPAEIAPGSLGQLVVTIDGESNTRQIRLPDGAASGQTVVKYEVEAPF